MVGMVHGLPTHPLLAHLVAVLVPLAALLAILAVVWPAARRRIGATPLLVATAALLLVPLTTAAGGTLRARTMMDGAVLSRHVTLGGQLIVWVALLTIALACWWALHTPIFAGTVVAVAPAARRIGAAGAGAATLLFALACVWSTVRAGDSGTQAVWGTLPCCAGMAM
jgi:hypothetical protein